MTTSFFTFCCIMGKSTDTIHKPVIEDQQDDVVESLNQLYRQFQDEYITSQYNGITTVVSKSHIVCNGSASKKIVQLPELYLLDTPEVNEIRSFVTLLPPHARFEIIHYPDYYDIFSIRWSK